MGNGDSDSSYGEGVLRAFTGRDRRNAPLTAAEVAGRLDRDEAAVREGLDALAERGMLDSRPVGDDRVWWPTGSTSSRDETGNRTGLPRAVFEESFDAMVVADDDGRYVDANPAACDLFGLPREELLGRSVAVFAPDGYDFEAAWAEFQASGEQRGTFPLVRVDGERRVVEFAATNDVLPNRHVSILRDVTDREARERELETITAIDALVGEMIQGIVDATSRRELERRVVDRLVESEFYDLAWIGDPATPGTGYADVVTAGLDDVQSLLAEREVDDPNASPAPRAYFTGELQVIRIDDARDDLPEPVADFLAEHEYRSAIAVPLVHSDVTYAVLAVASHRDDAFTDREQSAFETLGTVLGHAINTLETKKSLRADTLVEIEFAGSVDTGFFAVASERLDCTCTLDGVVVADDDRVLHYVRVRETTPEAVLDVADDHPDLTACRVVEESDGEFVVEMQLSTRGLARLSDVGATARRAVADAGTVELVVEVGSDADVSAVVDAVTSWCPNLEPVAKRQVSRPLEPAGGLHTSLDDRLTDRQATALEIAYRRGYFDWPREATAETVADALGVSSPTFHHHIRAAERKLLDRVFERETAE